MSFSDLGLSEDILKAVADAGYTEPTPIQAQAIPVVLMGRDILGCAQTGTGKTAGFTLPMIEILGQGRAKARMPRSLILEPTRELASQVAENFDIYGKYHKLSKALLIGGVSMADQMKAIDRGPDVLIATPGRLLDLFERGRLLMTDVKILVIDEADRMLDMGFIPDVEKIVSLVSKMRQTLFFSATMPPEIRRLADRFLMNPKEISVAPPSTPVENVTQGLVMVAHADGRRPGAGHKEKRAALRALIAHENVRNALVFCNRKRDVGILHRSMVKHGFSAGQLHGDMTQPARMEMLEKFKNGGVRFLICSDVAARGLDSPDLSHVFNFDVPTHPEDYVHRIGRTARAGKEGHAYTLAIREDGKYIDGITRLIGCEIPRVELDGIESPKGSVDRGESREERPERDRPSGKRRRSRRRGKSSQRGQGDVQAEKQKSGAGAPSAKPSGKPDQGRREKTSPPKPNTPVRGMGEHMPAFMQASDKPKQK